MVSYLIIILVCLFFYRQTVNYGYIIDDMEVATHKRTGNWLRDLWYQIRGHSYFNPKTEHTITLLIHTINCCLIYWAFGMNQVSFIAAMLFSVNPVNNQASVWLSGKVYALGAMFMLIGWGVKTIYPITYFLGSYFSLNVVPTPLLFLMARPHWWVLLIGVMILAYRMRLLFEPSRRFKDSSPEMQEYVFSKSPKRLIVPLKTFGYYLRLCFFPIRLGMCHEYLHVFGLTKKETDMWFKPDKYMFLGLSAISFLILGLVKGWDMLGLYWFTLCMLPWSNFVVLNHPICERYAYLANIGLMVFVAKLCSLTPLGSYLAVGLWVYYATRLFYFLPAYKTNLEYFKLNVDNFENVAIGYNQEGLERIRFNQAGTAVDIFAQGLFSRPNDFRLNYNLGNLLIGMGRFLEARSYIYKAEQNLDPNNNYAVWMENINILKHKIREGGKIEVI